MKFEDNPSPSLLFAETVEPSAPSANQQRLWIDTDHHLKTIDSSSTVVDFSASGGVGTGDAGAVLAMGNGAAIWNAGTSFPGSKATGDRYWRTDLGLECYWDGTRWVSSTLYHEQMGAIEGGFPTGGWGNALGTQSIGRWTPWHSDYDLWLVSLYGSTYVGATNDGSHYWTVSLFKTNAAGAETSIVTFATNADTQANYTTHAAAIGAAMGGATYKELIAKVTPTSTPGNIYPSVAISYRLIVT
jgi:hypothetical protein